MQDCKYCDITTALPDAETAKTITLALIENYLAAGVQQTEVVSTYRWNGEVKTKQEWVLRIKTQMVLYEKIEALINRLSPYEVSEIVCTPIIKGSPDFLNWITDETTK